MKKIIIILVIIPFIGFSQTIEVKYYNNQIKNDLQLIKHTPKEITPNYVQNHFSYTLTNSKNISVFKNDEIKKIITAEDTSKTYMIKDDFDEQIYIKDDSNINSFDYSLKENLTYKNFNSNILEYSYKLEDKVCVKDSLIDWEWKLIEGTEEILGYKCKIATTNKFGNLKTAYYTEDIKCTDGPFNFSGLTGLILKISNINSETIAYQINIKKENTTIKKPSFNFKSFKLSELETEINNINTKNKLELKNKENNSFNNSPFNSINKSK